MFHLPNPAWTQGLLLGSLLILIILGLDMYKSKRSLIQAASHWSTLFLILLIGILESIGFAFYLALPIGLIIHLVILTVYNRLKWRTKKYTPVKRSK